MLILDLVIEARPTATHGTTCVETEHGLPREAVEEDDSTMEYEPRPTS